MHRSMALATSFCMVAVVPGLTDIPLQFRGTFATRLGINAGVIKGVGEEEFAPWSLGPTPLKVQT